MESDADDGEGVLWVGHSVPDIFSRIIAADFARPFIHNCIVFVVHCKFEGVIFSGVGFHFDLVGNVDFIVLVESFFLENGEAAV